MTCDKCEIQIACKAQRDRVRRRMDYVVRSFDATRDAIILFCREKKGIRKSRRQYVAAFLVEVLCVSCYVTS